MLVVDQIISRVRSRQNQTIKTQAPPELRGYNPKYAVLPYFRSPLRQYCEVASDDGVN